MRTVAWVVVPAWVASRLVSFVLLAVLGSRTPPDVDTSRLLIWDGGWYREIVLNGYPHRPAVWPPGLGQWTTLPFFPLYPALADVLNTVGTPITVALTSVPNIAFLIALFGIYRLAEGQALDDPATLGGRNPADPHRVGVAAVWIAAALPGSLTFAMAYPDAIFLAGSAWAVLWASQNRYALAGMAAAVTTATRPNGALVVVTLILLVLTTPRVPHVRRATVIAWYTIPSVVFLAGWTWFMRRRTGDPFAFLTAKKAWDETTLYKAIRTPTTQTTWQLAIGVAAIVIIVAMRRRQPVAWTAHALMCVLPALAVGVVGLIRYAAQAFPLSIGLASAATRRGVAAVVCTVGACAALLAIYAYLITHRSYVP